MTLTINARGGCTALAARTAGDVSPATAEHCSLCPRFTRGSVPQQPRVNYVGWRQMRDLPSFTTCAVQPADCLEANPAGHPAGAEVRRD